MTWSLLLSEALGNLMAHKWRSLLAILGILVGAASVTAMLSIGTIATHKTLAEFQILGTDLMAIDLSLNDTMRRDSAAVFLTPRDWASLPATIPSIHRIAPFGLLPATLSMNGTRLHANALAADPGLFSLLRTQLTAGRLFSALDQDRNFCVIGSDVLMPATITPIHAIGQTLQIQNVFFTIVGVLKPWHGNSFFNNNLDQSVLISYASATKLPLYFALSSALLQLKTPADLAATQSAIVKQIHHRNGQLTATVRSASLLQETLLRQKHTLNLMLYLMSNIALLVGGIGIMNVMLVSVSERKKEIGLRLAIGARQHHIQALFLSEAALLGLWGGISGCILGELATFIISVFSDWAFHFYEMPVVMGLMISIFTCVFFGFYPAYHASRLNPITVLRTD